MSDEKPAPNAWLHEAIQRAKQSALPILVSSWATPDEDGNVDTDSLVDAIELSLLAVTGEVTEEKLRNSLRSIAELYAADIGTSWEKIADAIVGTLEWVQPDPKNHVLDSWKL